MERTARPQRQRAAGREEGGARGVEAGQVEPVRGHGGGDHAHASRAEDRRWRRRRWVRGGRGGSGELLQELLRRADDVAHVPWRVGDGARGLDHGGAGVDADDPGEEGGEAAG